MSDQDSMDDVLGFIMRGIAADPGAREAAQGSEADLVAYLLPRMAWYLDDADARLKACSQWLQDSFGWWRSQGELYKMLGGDALHAALVEAAAS